MYLTANNTAACGSTPGSEAMYFKISGHPTMAEMCIGCIPFYNT